MHTQSVSPSARPMFDALLIDSDAVHADRLARHLQFRGFKVKRVLSTTEAIAKLRERTSQYEIVVLNVSDPSRPWLAALDSLQEAGRRWENYSSPLFLCVSNRQREPQFELAIERKGARYVYER